jgi:hypothetical protein
VTRRSSARAFTPGQAEQSAVARLYIVRREWPCAAFCSNRMGARIAVACVRLRTMRNSLLLISNWRIGRLAILYMAIMFGACSIDAVTFTGVESSSGEEDCAVAGDEDDNGVADCDDPACMNYPVCQSSCGDGIVTLEEQCDMGAVDTMLCNGNMAGTKSCRGAACGDSYTNMAAGEKCDSGGVDTAQCNGSTCKMPACGDNYVNAAAGENCESAGGVDTVSCNGKTAGAVSCHAPACGDGYTNSLFTPPGATAFEACDNPGGGDTAGCNGNKGGANGPGSCRRPTCGDAYTNSAAGEECDVPGGVDTATCNGTAAGAKSCKIAICGDGYVNPTAGEQCESSLQCASPRICSSQCKCI